MEKCSQKVATKPKLLVAKDEMILANATDMVAISSPVVVFQKGRETTSGSSNQQFKNIEGSTVF